jgi:hypothetical protein
MLFNQAHCLPDAVLITNLFAQCARTLTHLTIRNGRRNRLRQFVSGQLLARDGRSADT